MMNYDPGKVTIGKKRSRRKIIPHVLANEGPTRGAQEWKSQRQSPSGIPSRRPIQTKPGGPHFIALTSSLPSIRWRRKENQRTTWLGWNSLVRCGPPGEGAKRVPFFSVYDEISLRTVPNVRLPIKRSGAASTCRPNHRHFRPRAESLVSSGIILPRVLSPEFFVLISRVLMKSDALFFHPFL